MKKGLSFEFSQVTEMAALAAFEWVGKGNKNAADDAAVKAMRDLLSQMAIRGEIVIGEGEIDDAPMLYIGESVGLNRAGDDEVSIAVDPIDGTRMTAMGQANALSVLAVGKQGAFLKAPDMYMEKLIVGKEAKEVIDLALPLDQNLHQIAKAKKKPLLALRVAILDKPRHSEIINQMQQLGVSVISIPDGDVAAAVQCCLPNANIDLLYGIGGAPEGVIAAAAVRALGGNMQARLLPRNQVKGNSVETQRLAEMEIARCKALNVPVNEILKLDDLVCNDEVTFVATGITHGELVKGIQYNNKMFTTETLLICGETNSIHKIQSSYLGNKKTDCAV